MKVLLSGIGGAIVLGVIAAVVLSMAQDSAYQVYSSSSTRLSDPGTNLIGGAWSGRRESGAASGSTGAAGGTGRTSY